GHRPYRLEVALGGLREACLDHVDAEPGQLLGDLDLVLGVEVDARRLLAVPQGRVEDGYVVRHGWSPPCACWLASRRPRTPRGGRHGAAPRPARTRRPAVGVGTGITRPRRRACAATTSWRAAARR